MEVERTFGDPEVHQLMVDQANQLVYGCYQMTLTEKRLLLLVMARLSRYDEKFQRYEIPVHQIRDYLGLNPRNYARDLRAACKNLMARFVELVDPTDTSEDPEWLMVSFVNWIRYRKTSEKSSIEIQLNEEMRPFLLGLKEKFQSTGFENLAKLNSFHAIRLFEILHHKRNETGQIRNEFDIEVKDLRKMLGIEKKYQNYNDLKRFVLEPSGTILNEKSPLGVAISTKRSYKRGGKVDTLKFRVWDQNHHSDKPSLSLSSQQLFNFGEMSEKEKINSVIEELSKHASGAKLRGMITKLYQQGHRREKVRANLELALNQIAKNPDQVRDPLGYIYKSVEGNYAKA